MVKVWFVNGQKLELDRAQPNPEITSYEEIIEPLEFQTFAELGAFMNGLERGKRYDDVEMGVYPQPTEALKAAAKAWETVNT